MAKTKEIIIEEIDNYISMSGKEYKNWYVGITNNPEEALFVRHRLKKDVDLCICKECNNSNIAREIEDYFVNIVGTAGGLGGGDYTTRYVYAYKIAPHTTEE